MFLPLEGVLSPWIPMTHQKFCLILESNSLIIYYFNFTFFIQFCSVMLLMKCKSNSSFLLLLSENGIFIYRLSKILRQHPHCIRFFGSRFWGFSKHCRLPHFRKYKAGISRIILNHYFVELRSDNYDLNFALGYV